jgi:hypothetical protein
VTATAGVALVLAMAVFGLIGAVLYLLRQLSRLADRLDATQFCLERLEKERRATWASAKPTSSLLSRPLKGPTFQGGNADAVD